MIAQQIDTINKSLPNGCKLVAVSKYHPIEAIKEAYNCGQRIFAESHVQELVKKHEALPNDIAWHFIGHLQTNKVKHIVSFVSLIHSVDSLRLMDEIEKQAAKIDRTIDILLELHVAQENTKSGFLISEIKELVTSGKLNDYAHINVVGLMAMASNTDNEQRISQDFCQAKALFDELQERLNLKELSMGMSHDYKIAIKHGSSLVRIGSMIFGDRTY